MSTAEHYDAEDTQEPNPQEYGFPVDATIAQLNCWDRQERFLQAYVQLGQIGLAAKAVGITRACVQRWQANDLYSFEKRLENAHKDHVELEVVDFKDWMRQSKHNTQIGRIFLLKALDPEQFREDIKVINADVPFQMLDRLKEMAMQERQRRAALEAPSVEAVYKEVPPNQEPGSARPEQTTPPTPAPPSPAPPPRAWRMPPQRPPRPPDNGDSPGQVKRR